MIAPGAKVLLVAGAAIVALLLAIPAQSTSRPQYEYVHGRNLHFIGIEAVGRLRQPLFAPLLGQDVPLAIPSPTGGQLLYHAWDGKPLGAGVPVLRLYDREGGPERLIARGAQSAAWRHDGSLAYMQATVRRYVPTPQGTFGGRYGQVLVRRSLAARPVHWTREHARPYVVVAWAGTTLLIEIQPSHLRRDARPPGVYALDGPGRLRPLPLRQLVAISPDGRRAFGSFGAGDSRATSVRLVDVTSGRLLAQRDVADVAGLGDWRGDAIVAPMVNARLAIFRVSARAIASTRRIVPARGSVQRPVFTGNRAIVVHVTVSDARDDPTYVGFATCDRASARCRRGPDLRPAIRWAALIANDSRPRR